MKAITLKLLVKSFFFPFSKRYSGLSKYGWHRFAVVAYWVAMVMCLWGAYRSFQSPEEDAFTQCVGEWSRLTTTPQEFDKQVRLFCGPFEPTTGMNFLIAVIVAFIFSYLVEVLYYKIVPYIAFGSNGMRNGRVSPWASFP